MKFPLSKMQTKQVSFNVTECKQDTKNGVPVGIIEGYASTWEQDRDDDVILKGAFRRTIDRHLKTGRPIRMLRQHTPELIGGFPIETVKETDQGLFVRGEINLDVQKGKESFSLAKQNVLTDMSIGFSFDSIDDFYREEVDGKVIRFIKNLNLWEISLVNEPANEGAQIVNVKTITPFKDLPLASRDRAWDSGQAISRIRAFTGSDDEPATSYKDAFLWYDGENQSEFGAYKLPYADVIDGRLYAIPRAIFAAAAAMRGARGGIDIPAGDRPGVISHIDRYYNKMDLPSPFNSERGLDRSFLEICKNLSDVEEFLKFWDMSAKDRKALISTIKGLDVRDDHFEADEHRNLDRDDSELLKAMLSKCDNLTNEITLKSIHKKLDLLI